MVLIIAWIVEGQGYSLHALRVHIGRSKGFCKQHNPWRTFYTCPYCQTDYVHLRSLEIHNTNFGDTCKTWQIPFNNRRHFQAG